MEPDKQCEVNGSQRRPNWGGVIFACLMAAVILGFAWSVVDAARRTTDWLLIAPGAVIAALAFLWAGVADIRAPRRVTALTEAARSDAAQPIILIALTCGFAIVAPFIGFDLGSAIFIFLCLLVQGERSFWRLTLASIGGAALMTWIFAGLLMVRLPTMFL
jgi:hypothetical protein